MNALPETYWAKVNKRGPVVRTDLGRCWIWTGAIQSRGYGSFVIDGRSYLTHRLSHEAHDGPIEDGLTIDHLCMNKACVRPDHLEAVTVAENNRRARVAAGYFIGGRCGFGHELTEESTKISRGRLVCRPCMKRHQQAQILKDTPADKPASFMVHEWAISQGIPVATAGRLPKALYAAYAEAQVVAA